MKVTNGEFFQARLVAELLRLVFGDTVALALFLNFRFVAIAVKRAATIVNNTPPAIIAA